MKLNEMRMSEREKVNKLNEKNSSLCEFISHGKNLMSNFLFLNRSRFNFA